MTVTSLTSSNTAYLQNFTTMAKNASKTLNNNTPSNLMQKCSYELVEDLDIKEEAAKLTKNAEIMQQENIKLTKNAEIMQQENVKLTKNAEIMRQEIEKDRKNSELLVELAHKMDAAFEQVQLIRKNYEKNGDSGENLNKQISSLISEGMNTYQQIIKLTGQEKPYSDKYNIGSDDLINSSNQTLVINKSSDFESNKLLSIQVKIAQNSYSNASSVLDNYEGSISKEI